MSTQPTRTIRRQLIPPHASSVHPILPPPCGFPRNLLPLLSIRPCSAPFHPWIPPPVNCSSLLPSILHPSPNPSNHLFVPPTSFLHPSVIRHRSSSHMSPLPSPSLIPRPPPPSPPRSPPHPPRPHQPFHLPPPRHLSIPPLPPPPPPTSSMSSPCRGKICENIRRHVVRSWTACCCASCVKATRLENFRHGPEGGTRSLKNLRLGGALRHSPEGPYIKCSHVHGVVTR